MVGIKLQTLFFSFFCLIKIIIIEFLVIVGGGYGCRSLGHHDLDKFVVVNLPIAKVGGQAVLG